MDKTEIMEKYWEQFLVSQVATNRHMNEDYWQHPTVEHNFWLWFMQTIIVNHPRNTKATNSYDPFKPGEVIMYEGGKITAKDIEKHRKKLKPTTKSKEESK